MTSPVPKPPIVVPPDPAISDPIDRIQPRPGPPPFTPPTGPVTTLPYPADMLPPGDPANPATPPTMPLGEGGPAPVEMQPPQQSANRQALARLLIQGRMRGRGQRF